MNLENRTLDTFRAGIYLHYKGTLYEADHLVRDANDDTRIAVHYIGLDARGAKDGPRHMVRTWEDWNAKVHQDGTTCDDYDGEMCRETNEAVMQRFRFVGAFYTAEMQQLVA